MKRIVPLAMVLLLTSCQTTVAPPRAPKDYAAIAAAAVGKYTITDNDVYGFVPDGRLDPTLSILGRSKDGDWTVYKVPVKRADFDYAEVTVNGSDTILRLQFFKTTHTSFGRQDAFNTIYRELKSTYKVVQSLGDNDLAELTVHVADSVQMWERHYVEYLQLMDEPNNLGAQFSWILQPHLYLIQARFRRTDNTTQIVVDYQTKAYAVAMAAREAAAAKAAAAARQEQSAADSAF